MKRLFIAILLSAICCPGLHGNNEPLSDLAGRIKIHFPGPPAVQRVQARMDLSDVAKLSFNVRFQGISKSNLWLSVFVITDDHLRYRSSSSFRIKPGKKETISVRVAPLRNEFEPCGHFKPWTLYEASNIRAAGIKLHTGEYARGNVYIWNVETEKGNGISSLTLYDFRHTTTRAGLEISFRTLPALPELYSRKDIEIRGTLSGYGVKPDQVRNAFAYQGFVQTEGSSTPLRKSGPVEWKIRFSPPHKGTYTCSIQAFCKKQQVFSSGSFPVEYTPIPEKTIYQPDIQDTYSVEHPGPHVIVSVLSAKRWRIPRKQPLFKHLWYPILQWKNGWGYFHGLNRFNQHRMFRFDEFLDSQTEQGYIVLHHDSELCLSADFHWADNPLNASNGGPLRRISEFYSDNTAFDNLKNRIAYAIARWGSHPAVQGFVIANTMPAPAGPEWNKNLAVFLADPCFADILIASFHPQAVRASGAERVASAGMWKIHRDIKSTGYVKSFDDTSVTVKGSFPGEIPLAAKLKGNWAEMDGISFQVHTPPDAPEHMRVLVYVRDQQWTWYQKLLKCPLRVGDVTSYILSFSKKEGWDTPGEKIEWFPYTPLRIRELGIRILGNKATDRPLTFAVTDITVFKRKKPSGAEGKCLNITLNSSEIRQYEKLEITFELDKKYKNPFDPECISVDGVFSTPDNRTVTVPAFFYQPFSRTMKRGREVLIPSGKTKWKIRFTPAAPGTYAFRIHVKDTENSFDSDTASFTCIPSAASKGFIRSSPSGYFVFDDGTFFYPIGMNIRSPADTRQPYRYPFSQYEGKGTYAYDLYFRKMKDHRMNWSRIWLCSWWCGLEWREDWGSYAGIGYFNMKNAWRFDYVLKTAEEHGIYLQVDTMNHGQLSLKIDREWDHNPYNTALGGFLSRPEDYFTHPKAQKLHKHKLRYIVSRWGYSPYIMAWMLLTEVEFTEEYFNGAYKNGNIPGTYPKTTAWHKEMARYMKRIDPWKHLVGTHFSHPHRGSDIWSLPEMDIAESNAYTAFLNFQKFNLGRSGQGIDSAIDNYYHRLFKKYKKPVLIGEYGGHWSHNSPQLLDSELHCGIWTSLMTPLAGNTGYWWWPHIHFMDLYDEYLNAAHFIEGEDLTKLNLRRTSLRVSSPGRQIRCLALRNSKNTVWAWIYDPRIIVRHISVRNGKPVERYTQYFKKKIPITDASVTIPCSRGTYTIEFWNTYTGTVESTETISVLSRQNQKITIPSFKNDIALKLHKK